MPPFKRRKGFKPRVRKAKAVSRSLTKNQKKEVKKLIMQPAETKYVANTVSVYGGGAPAVPASAFGVLQFINTGGANFNAWNLIPALSPGIESGAAGTVITGANQRVGNKISNVRITSTWQFYINPAISNYPTIDATVKVFILKSKSIKSNQQLGNIPAGSLLDLGNGSSGDWSPVSTVSAKENAMYPVNKEQFTVLKIHQFRLCKNGDSPTGGTAAGAAPNMTSHQTKDFTHTYIHKGNVIYPDNNLTGNVMPTNISYFAYVVCYDTNTFQTLPSNSILCNARTHMWFKDI